MRDIPCDLGGYTLMVTEAPEIKTFEKDGKTEIVIDQATKAQMYVISVFAKRRPTPDRKFKGEEIKVTIETDPGELDTGTYIELINCRVSPYNMKSDSGDTIAGISFRATGVTPRG